MHEKAKLKVYTISSYLEMFIALVLAIVIAVLAVKLLISALIPANYEGGDEFLNNFLSSALNLAVGVELVKMLTRQTPSTVVEVLMFAIARQMVVEHLDVTSILVGVTAIGGLFAIRKFLFYPSDTEDEFSAQHSFIRRKTSEPGKKGEEEEI